MQDFTVTWSIQMPAATPREAAHAAHALATAPDSTATVYEVDGTEYDVSMRYVAGWNIPGCLPEAEPEEFATYTEALAYIVNTVDSFWTADEHVPSIDADARWLDLHTALHVAGGRESFRGSTEDDHLAFWIDPIQ